MSISLNLVVYQRNNDDLVEEDMRTAMCKEIPPSILNAIRKKFPSQKCKVYYDDTKEDFFEIDFFARTDIPEIINYLRVCFDDLLDYEYILRNPEAHKPSPKLKTSDLAVFTGTPNQNDLDRTSVAISRFRVLISLIDIFSEMQKNYINEPNAVLKIG